MSDSHRKIFLESYRRFRIFSGRSSLGVPVFWAEYGPRNLPTYITDPADSTHTVKADILDYWDLRR